MLAVFSVIGKAVKAFNNDIFRSSCGIGCKLGAVIQSVIADYNLKFCLI